MKIRERFHILLTIAALAFQVIPPILLLALANGFYGESPCLPISWERPLSLGCIALFALVSFILSLWGTYGLLTHQRLRTAIPFILFCSFPAMLGGATYLHALLVFLAWV